MFRYLSRHRSRIVFMCGGILVLTIAFISLIDVASASSLLPSAPETFNSQHSQQDTPSPCLQAMPEDPQAAPSLAFCSPDFGGDIEGPFGSHITLIGENFPAPPTTILLVPKINVPDQQTITPAIIQKCLSKQMIDCFQVPVPSGLNARTFLIPFVWNFQVKENLTADFFAVALVGNDPNSQFFQSPAATTFTLLNAQAPCIIVEKQSTGCTPQQSLSFTASSTITLQGQNWLPRQQRIKVTMTCLNDNGLVQEQPISSVVVSDAKGNFPLTENLPQNFSGNCAIQASNQAKTVANPGSDHNTIADGTLSFGNKDDVYQLTIALQLPLLPPTPTVAPTPSSTKTPPPPNPPPPVPNLSFFTLSDLLALLAMLPAAFALFRYAQLRKRPTSQKAIDASEADKPQEAYLLTEIVSDMMSHLPASKPQSIKEWEIQNAVNGLNREEPAMAIQLVTRTLQSDPKTLDTLLQAISNSETNSTLSSQEETFLNMKRMYGDRKNAFQHCSEILINSRLELKSLPPISRTFVGTDILFNVSFAYSSLPGISPEIDRTYLQKALKFYQSALETYRLRQYAPAIAATWHNTGNIYMRLSTIDDHMVNMRKAIEYFTQAANYYKTADTPSWAGIMTQMGDIRFDLWQETNQDLEDLKVAIQCFEDTLRIYKVHQYPEERANACYMLGKIHYTTYESGDVDKLNTIKNYLKQAESIYRELDKKLMRAKTLYMLGSISLEFAEIQKSKGKRSSYLTQAIKHYDHTLQLTQDASLQAECRKLRGNAYEKLGDYEQAVHDYSQAASIYNIKSHKSLDERIEIYELLVKAQEFASLVIKNQQRRYRKDAIASYQTLQKLYTEKQPKNEFRQRIAEIEKRIGELKR
ncbi:MAG TPA: tetratricopeptide repeat protein [Ktedonobacteraceae bacterium]|nr:tetratricopeptide repeat protein [Ktedonobacteraceae bacterium]